MMTWTVALFLALGFLWLTHAFGLLQAGKSVVACARQSWSTLRSSTLSDEDKEMRLRRDSGRLFLLFMKMAFGGAAALFIPFGIAWLFDSWAWISLKPALELLVSPVFIVLISAPFILVWWFRRRRTHE